MSDKKAMSELSSSVCKGTGYEEIYLLGRKPKEDFPWSLEREMSAHSLHDEEENKEKDDEGDVEGDKDEEDEDNEEDEGIQFEGVELVG